MNETMMTCYFPIYSTGLISALLGFAISLPTAWAAEVEKEGTFNLLIENDKFTGTDQHYTNGIQISFLTGKDNVPNWLRAVAVYLPGISDYAALRTGYVIGHNIYTPEDVETREPIFDDRPYAGWLYGGLALVAETEDQLDTWQLELGIVGPSARGEEVQNSFHKLIGVDEAEGWDNQLDDEFGYALTYEHKWRNLAEFRTTGYGVDITPHIGGSIGNVGTYLNAGFTVRLGKDLVNDFGPPRIRPSLPGSAFYLPRNTFGWYLFAGVDGRAVGYNIFLDGNTDKDSLEVDREVFVGDAQAGLAVQLGGLRFAYTYVIRSPEFEEQEGSDRFGAISISAKF